MSKPVRSLPFPTDEDIKDKRDCLHEGEVEVSLNLERYSLWGIAILVF